MGIIRKLTSVSTAGLVDFRSDKERTARSTRQTAHESKQQTKIMQEQLKLQKQQQAQPAPVSQPTVAAAPQPIQMAAGWYQYDGQPRYWDGNAWH